MKVPQLILILGFEDSRKVGFGVWLIILATALLAHKLIDSSDWMLCMAVSSTLIGGGTVADAWLKIKGNQSVDNAPKQ